MSVGGMRWGVVAVLVAVALGGVACGSEDDGGGATAGSASSDEQQIRDSISTMQKAMNERDWESVCDVLAKEPRKIAKQAEGHPTCEQGIGDLLTDDATGTDVNEESESISIDTVEINGDRALVTGTQLDQKGLQRATVVREGGSWKIASWFD
jgi:hypothetical protein